MKTCFSILTILMLFSPAVQADNITGAKTPDATAEKRAAHIKSLNDAAEHGDVKAQIELGRRYSVGAGVPLDKQESIKWFGKAAAQGDADGLLWLAGTDRPPWSKDSDAYKWEKQIMADYQAKAEKGDAAAQFKYGQLLRRNFDDSDQFGTGYIAWWEKAAAQGNAEAEVMLAASQQFNEEETMKWWQKAADQGDAMAAGVMAEHYSGMGRFGPTGVPKDTANWLKYLRIEGEGGVYVTQRYLGDLYAQGKEVPKDLAESNRWYLKSLEHEADPEYPDFAYSFPHIIYAEVKALLGEGYHEMGNDTEAVKYWKMAAEAGIPKAQYALGQAYMEGRGVEKNPTEAEKWLSEAKKSGPEQIWDILRPGPASTR